MTRQKWDRIDERKRMRSRGVEDVKGGDLPFGLARQKPALRKGYGDVRAATQWLVENRQRLRDEGRHPVAELQREFGITAKQCVEAIRSANVADHRGR